MRCHRCDDFVTSEMVFCSQCGWVVVKEQAADETAPAVHSFAIKKAVKRATPAPKPKGVPGSFRQLESLANAIAPKRSLRSKEKRAKQEKRIKKSDPSGTDDRPEDVILGWIYVVPTVVNARCLLTESGRLLKKGESAGNDGLESMPCWSYSLKTLLVEGPDADCAYRPLRKLSEFEEWVTQMLPQPDSIEAAEILARLGWQLLPVGPLSNAVNGPVLVRQVEVTKKTSKSKRCR